MCVRVGFPTPASSSPTPTGGLTSQLISDTVCPGRGIRSHRSRAQSLVPLTDQLYTRGSNDPLSFSGSTNFLDQLTERRRTFCLLDYRFTVSDIKGYESISWMKRRTGQGMGKGPQLLSPLPARDCPQMCRCSPTQKLSEPSPSGVLWRLRYRGTMITSPARGTDGGGGGDEAGTESSNPLLT